MGRYVSGDWEWKFAFGDQSSSLGFVLEEILDNQKNKDASNYMNRFVGTQGDGERLELWVEDWNIFADTIAEYIGEDFKLADDKTMREWSKCGKKLDDEYWNRVMMRKFLKDLYDKTDTGRGNNYYFSVEY
jgi:hypothetical protein